MPMEPFIGDIYAFSFGFPPKGWAQCNGQTLPINQNQALYSILGTTYGGDGVTTFQLPNLIGRVPVHVGNGISYGARGGENSHTLTVAEMPAHNHVLRADATTGGSSNSGTPQAGNSLGQSAANSGGNPGPANLYSTAAANATLAPQTIANQGGNQPHENRQPFLALNYCIALVGVFPSRS